MQTTTLLGPRRALDPHAAMALMAAQLRGAPLSTMLVLVADAAGSRRRTREELAAAVGYPSRVVALALRELREARWISPERGRYELREDGPLAAAFVPMGIRPAASKVEFRGCPLGDLEPAAKALESAFRAARRVKRLAPSSPQLPAEHREECARWLTELSEDLGEELEPLASRVMFEWLRIDGQATPNWPLGYLKTTGWRLRDFPRDLSRVATALRARRRPRPAAEPIARHILSAAESAAAAEQALRAIGGAR